MAARRERQLAMERVLRRAADRFADQAAEIDARIARRRKGRPGDEDVVVARTLHVVVRQLRKWADLVAWAAGHQL